MSRLIERVVVGGNTYRLATTEESSAKFGPCEVCGKWASEVHIQSHLDAHGCYRSDGFGHRECLVGLHKET